MFTYIVQSVFFTECRIILLKMMMLHMKELLEKGEELEVCVRLLGDILTMLRSSDVVSSI